MFVKEVITDGQSQNVAKIESLAENPRGPDPIKLLGAKTFCTRVGDYRIIYAIADERLVVLIVDVGNRREIYRRF